MVQGCIGPVSALSRKIKINKRKRSWIRTNDELADVRVYAFDEYCGILRDHQSTLKSFAARATVLFTILLSIQVEHRGNSFEMHDGSETGVESSARCQKLSVVSIKKHARC